MWLKAKVVTEKPMFQNPLMFSEKSGQVISKSRVALFGT